jgi:hypothetical protein
MAEGQAFVERYHLRQPFAQLLQALLDYFVGFRAIFGQS